MRNTLEQFIDPLLGRTWFELGSIRRMAIIDGQQYFDVELGYPVGGLESSYTKLLSSWTHENVALNLSFRAPDSNPLTGVKNVLAVASGKGGVGKSTTAVNLAVGLAKAGARTGLLDADIYGPSQGIMLGIADGRRPEVRDGKYFVPIRQHGIEAISMSMLVDERTPMAWRGPMASSALKQLLQQTIWGNLDYLIVDMPPGTGDIQLTLSQQVPLGGAVIITTPQEIALADARKSIEMFVKLSVPILGVIENMSYFRCDGCGKRHAIFDSAGGEKVANGYQTKLLGQFPLSTEIRALTDAGTPPAASTPAGEISDLYVGAARSVAAELWQSDLNKSPTPTISMDDQ